MKTFRRALRAMFPLGFALSLPLECFPIDDCNQNGIDDGQDLAAGTSKDCNLNGAPDECDLAPVHLGFSAAGSFPIGEGGAQRTAFGDFDGDGNVDVVVITPIGQGSSRAVVLLDKGGGVFAEPRPVSSLDVGWCVAPVDLNQDGRLDLILGMSPNNTLYTFFNLGGATFGNPRITTFDGGVTECAAADLDGDGDVDLATINGANRDVLLFVNSARGFLTPRKLDMADPDASPLWFIHSADFDGDRDADLLVGCFGPPGFSLLRNRGNGTFDEEPQRDDLTFYEPPLIEDFDGDGDQDLLVGHKLVMLVPNRGDGLFDPPRTTGLAASGFLTPSNTIVGDLDGDRRLDLVFNSIYLPEPGATATLVVARNRGDGTFRVADWIPTGDPVAPLNVVDFNRDGLSDLLAYNPRGLAVFLGLRSNVPISPDVNRNQVPDECDLDCDVDQVPDDHAIATGRAPDCDRNGVPDACDVRARVRFAPGECMLERGNGEETSDSLATVDFDKDGDLDIALLVSLGFDANPDPFVHEEATRLVLLVNPGNGTFIRVGDLDFDLPLRSLAAGDLDGDGDPDLVGVQWSGGSVVVLWNDGAGFTVGEAFPALKYPLEVYPLDLDRDGRVDLLVQNDDASAAVLVNQDAAFAAPREFSSAGRIAAVVDLSGDGAPDLVTRGRDGFTHIAWNDGAAAWNQESRLAERSFFLAAADLDGDGDVDLAMKEALQRGRTVLLNRGNFTFEPGPRLPEGDFHLSSLAADLDGDGDLDLLAGTRRSLLAALLNDGRAGFSGPFPLEVELPPATSPRLAADLDRDGRPDLVAPGSGQCLVSVALNRTLPPARPDLDRDGVPDECGPPPGGQVAGDGNQDGKLDLSDAVWLLARLFAGAGGPWPCDGGAQVEPGRGNLRLLDLNQDGALDISDPIAILRFLFFAAPPPALGTGCVPIAGCPALCAP